MNASDDTAGGRPDGVLGVGLIGTGEFGRYLVEALAGLPGYALAAVARGRHPTIAEQVAGRYGADAVDGLEGLLHHPRVDAVLIASPPSQHAPQTRAAVAAGRHVFCEKPLTTGLADADEVIEAARRRGVVVMVNHVMRWNPLYSFLRRLGDVNLGARSLLGALTHFGLRNYGSIRGLGRDHWFWDEAVSGGIFIEHGVHFFDAYHWLAGGGPESVSGVRLSTPRGRAPLDVALATLAGPRGATATFLHSFTKMPVTQHCELSVDWEYARAELTGWLPVTLDLTVHSDRVGEAAVRELTGAGTAALAVAGYEPTKGEELRIEAIRPADGGRDIRLVAQLGDEADVYRSSVRAAMANFIDAVRTGAPTAVSLADARLSVAVAVAATRGAAHARAIPLPGTGAGFAAGPGG